MILKLNPEHPLVWRSPDTIQLGIDRPVAVVDRVTPAIEVMLFALQAGVPRSGLYMLGEEAGADHSTITAFLKQLRPALVAPAHERHHAIEAARAIVKSVHIDGAGQSANRLRGALGELGIPVCPDGEADEADLVVLFGYYVFDPERHRRWLRRDIPHLPVLFGDNGARIGPMVEPGDSPCLFCVELERADTDPAWPAIAAQLLTRHPPAESVRLSLDVVARVAALVDDHLAGRTNRLRAHSLGVDPNGHVTRHVHRVHERCGCGVLPGLATLTPDSSRRSA
ncbi:hypothetical protein [Glaciibacter superstes]|uniref:hypothetical protein n=1 Tax=Glaciibacter superstes TaxID=501023 RepID=UPI0012FA509C|nr:hypothetical protein [Glaciibacter superstes]